jgi:nucleoside-diphosphate-sugar epimerase
MRILLAGASGAIGRHLVPLLTRTGHAVTGITRSPGSLAGTGASELVADLLDRPALLAAVAGRQFDAVIHQATSLGRTPRRFSQLRLTNRLRAEGTSALIAAARATGATRFVTASSTYGYGFGDFGSRAVGEDAVFAEAPGGAVDSVLRALATNEQQARAFGGVALRYGLFYRGRGTVPVVPAGWEGTLPFVHVEDAASAALAALGGAPGGVYNIVDDTPASWRAVQFARAQAFDMPEPTALPAWLLRRTMPASAELLGATTMRVSNERARTELRWTPAYPSFSDGIAADAATAKHVHTVIAALPRPSRIGAAGSGPAGSVITGSVTAGASVGADL